MSTQYEPVTDEELPLRLKHLIEYAPDRFRALQCYIDEPPGEGMAVIYVKVFPNGKMYIGQHCHGNGAKSYRITRMHASRNKGQTLLARAFDKYNEKNVRHFIIAHCPAGCNRFSHIDDKNEEVDANDLETFYINEWNTLAPTGYNLQSGGMNSAMHPDTLAALRERCNRPEWKWKRSQQAQETNSRPEVKEKISAASKKHWEENYDEMCEVIKNSQNRPEVKDAKREATAKSWTDGEIRNRRITGIHAAMKTPEYSEKQSVIMKEWFTNHPDARIRMGEASRAAWSDPDKRKMRAASISERRLQPGMHDKLSKAAKEVNSRPEVKEKQRASMLARQEELKTAQRQAQLRKDTEAWRPRFEACTTDDQRAEVQKEWDEMMRKREKEAERNRQYKKRKRNGEEPGRKSAAIKRAGEEWDAGLKNAVDAYYQREKPMSKAMCVWDSE